jgi:lipopolysaccharide/colanic/teichoic acid biosynthesis glycosyltransferase
VKRATDVSLSLVLIALTSPIWIVAAMRIWLYDRGPIFYCAPRVGRFGVPFTMHKFRTMVLNADRIGASSTSADDPRITPVGHWMRRWKVDELPQLLDVLVGNMSLVGPRPQVEWAVNRYSSEERRTLEVRPGITDWASIVFSNEAEVLKGHADPDAAYMQLIHPTKMRLALLYVERTSILTDLRILFSTAMAILGRRPSAEQLLASESRR